MLVWPVGGFTSEPGIRCPREVLHTPFSAGDETVSSTHRTRTARCPSPGLPRPIVARTGPRCAAVVGRWMVILGGVILGGLLLLVGASTAAVAGEALASEPASSEPASSEVQAISGSAPYSRLAGSVAEVMEHPALRRVEAGVHLVHVDSGVEVFSARAREGFVPASTMKVITSAAALRYLGPAWRFTTRFLYDGELEDDGVLKGNLYVVGGGDPTLVLEGLWKMVYDLRQAGVQEVEGNVIFDDTVFDSNPGIPGWTKRVDILNGPSYFPSLGALSLNYNTIALVVGPGEAVGQPARAELETECAVIELENRARTSARGSRRWLDLDREVDGTEARLELSGTVPSRSRSRRYYRAVPDATAYFTGAFAAMCHEHGIEVKGHYLSGESPEDAEELLEFESEPLAALLMTVNKYSNNFMAEQILKALGAEVRGPPGTTEKGVEVVYDYLEGLGIPRGEPVIRNGSGLTRETAIHPAHLTAVLLDMADDPRVGSEFRTSLAIGGMDGTLRRRFGDEGEVGRVRGKTGSLNGVHCLTGYAESADGELFAFAFLSNRIPGPLSRVRRVHDQFVRAILDYEIHPTTSELSP